MSMSGILENSLGVLVVNVGCLAFYLLARRSARKLIDRSFIGYYLVLMPVGLVAWFDLRFLPLAFFVIGGLLVLTHQARGVQGNQAERKAGALVDD
jgi:hypothetical protein